MKVRTLATFTDKYTGEIRRTGDIFECSEERLAEIKSTGRFAEAIPDKETQSLMESDHDYQRLAAMSVTELLSYADQRFKMTFHEGVQKAEIIAAILNMERKKG